MFQKKIETMPIPERVFELCHIVMDYPALRDEVRKKMEPREITSYFGSVLTAAKELHIVEEAADHTISYSGNPKTIRTMTGFRKYCNSVLYSDTNTPFYQVAVCFLNSNLEWLSYGTLSDAHVLEDVRKNTNLPNVYEDTMRGMRFWMTFLGFGFVMEKSPRLVFLPNMYTALTDFMQMADFEKKKEYTLSEFIEKLMPYAHVALDKVQSTHTLNYAMSAALRMMYDKKEILLQRNPDSKEVWNLYRQEDHSFVSEISHITILKEAL